MGSNLAIACNCKVHDIVFKHEITIATAELKLKFQTLLTTASAEFKFWAKKDSPTAVHMLWVQT